MNKMVLIKLQEINSLLWVLDLDKAKPVLEDLVIMSKKSEDPFFSKMTRKYKRTYDELNAQLNQEKLNFVGVQELDHSTEQEYGHLSHSDEFASSLLIIKNRFELEIRVVMGALKKLEYAKESIVVTNFLNARKVEESKTALVYSISFTDEVQRFGEITFTQSGIAIGRVFSNEYPILNDESIVTYEGITVAIIELAKKIYSRNEFIRD
ncbi:hypothetical protein [Paenibacillus sp. FSL R5-0486]|uniref:hypothetical protein n=1 Tax=Paenibacillus sp. FSL R5-0486 TaxID=2921645 RepID=UPI0030D77111